MSEAEGTLHLVHGGTSALCVYSSTHTQPAALHTEQKQRETGSDATLGTSTLNDVIGYGSHITGQRL